MPSLGKTKVRSGDRDDYIETEFTINVTADGLFTTTLNEDIVNTLTSVKIELRPNKRGRLGFFSSNTRDGLVKEVKHVLDEYMSSEVIEEKIVIKYAFATVASFGFALSGDIVPNMGWREDGPLNEELHWQDGTIRTHAADPHPVGVQMYVKPYKKIVSKFKSGKIKEIYKRMTPFGSSEVEGDDKYYLKWLEGIASTKPPFGAKVHEIDYTEERAKFFVNTFKSLCKIAHTIAQFEEPDHLLEVISNGKLLMGHE